MCVIPALNGSSALQYVRLSDVLQIHTTQNTTYYYYLELPPMFSYLIFFTNFANKICKNRYWPYNSSEDDMVHKINILPRKTLPSATTFILREEPTPPTLMAKSVLM